MTLRDSLVGLTGELRGSAVAGVVAKRTRELLIEDVRIRRTAFPLVLDQLTDVRIEGLEASGGIVSSLFDSGNAQILGSRFHQGGLFIGGSMRDLSVVGTTFSETYDGIGHLDRPDDHLDGGYFCGNVFEGITGGNPALYLPRGEDVTVRGNVFRDMESALWMKFTDRGLVELNDVQVEGSSTFSVAVQTRTQLRMHNNSLLDGGAGVNAVGPVDARDNWWGAADGPGGDLGGNGTNITFTYAGGSVAPWASAAPDLSAVACEPPAGARAPTSPAPIAHSADLAADVRAEGHLALPGRSWSAALAHQLIIGTA